MADEIFEHPRLAAIYDALAPDRSDLDVSAAIVGELGGGRVLDVAAGRAGSRSCWPTRAWR